MRIKFSQDIVPNKLTILWFLLIICVITYQVGKIPMLFQYVTWVYSAIIGIKYLFSEPINMEEKKMIFFCYFLFILQILGLFWGSSIFGFRNAIATICIFLFFFQIRFMYRNIQLLYITILYFGLLGYLITVKIAGGYLGNSLSGILIFSMVAFILSILRFKERNEKYDLKKHRIKEILLLLILSVIVLWLSWYSESRTAFFTLIFILIVFIVFRTLKINEKKMNWIFWILIILIILFTYCYINITSFSWYEKLNYYSNIWFDKNIASGRDLIWRISLNELDPIGWILGDGTDRLPTLARYQNASFHNSYIQLIMQNGVLGLSCLIGIFYNIWKKLTVHSNDSVILLCLACFVGILVYNCFECTLLQNKALVGMFQWLVLGIGLGRSQFLDQTERMVK